MPVDLSIPNSIIQAYLQGSLLRRQKEQDTLEQQNKERQFADFEKQLDAHLKDLEEQQKLRRQQMELGEKKFRLDVRKAIMTGVREGDLKPSETTVQSPVPVITPIGNFPTPMTVPTPGATYKMEGVEIPQNEFYTPEEKRAAQFGWFEKQLAAQSAARVREKQQLQPLEIEKIEKTGQQHIAQAQATAQSSLIRTLATIEGRHADVAATNAARIAAARLRATDKPENNPDIIKANAIAASLGEANLTGMSKNDMLVRKTLTEMNFTPFGAKESETLKSQHDVESLYNDMLRLADKLPESRIGAVGTYIRSIIPNDEIKLLQDRIRGAAGNIARTQGGERGVITERDLNRALGLLVSGGMTKSNAVKQIQVFREREINKINETILGRVRNPLQRFLLLQKHDFDPETYGGTTNYKGKQIPIFHKKSDGSYEYYKNGKYYDLIGGE